MEPNIIYRATMAWKLVQKLSGSHLPNSYALVTTTSCDSLALRIPTCFEQVPLLARGGAIVCLNTTICGCKWSNIPCPDGGIVCVGEQSLVVRRNLKRGYCVSVAQQRVSNSLFP